MAKRIKLSYEIGPTSCFKFRYRFLVITVGILFAHVSLVFSFSIWLVIKKTKISIRSDCRSKYIISVNVLSNTIYTHRLLTSSSHALILIGTMWLISLLLSSDDVHPNPGPADFELHMTCTTFFKFP